MKIFFIIIALFLAGPVYALTAEEGQIIFNELFYPIIGFFGISIMIGLFIKVINRS
jgi:heme/copper-type cytochrome/quinol oxidase subunit 3